MQKKQNKPPMDKNDRKRGRPAGKNRVPLSLEERRARNAQYERERRNETAEAMVQLAEAAGCDPQITNPELLATVINRLQNEGASQTLDDLKRINEDLESQIAALQSRLESDPNFDERQLEVHSGGRISSHSDSTSESVTGSENRRPTKYRKTSRRNKVHSNTRLSSSTSHPESSTDSLDSDWSNHHLGKTLPAQTLLQLQPITVRNELDSNNSTSAHIKRTDSASTDTISTRSRLTFQSEFYSETSEHSEAFSEKSNQRDVKVEIQLLPELGQIKTDSVEEQNNISSIDPFTDGEKAILQRLGWSDFIDFQGAYSENQSNLRLSVDYAGF